MKEIFLILVFASLCSSIICASLNEILDEIETVKRLLETDELAINKKLQKKIIGGEEVKAGEYPYLVTVQIDGVQSFTGTLIGHKTVLTCAHCLQVFKEFPLLLESATVLIGVHNTSQESIHWTNIFKIIDYFIYPTWKENVNGNPKNDIGIFILNATVDLSSLDVKLVERTSGNDLKDYRNCFVVGYGYMDEKKRSFVPLKMSVKLVNTVDCEKEARETFPDWTMYRKNVCAKSSSSNHCQGDSGGPLLCDDKDGKTVQLAMVSTAIGLKYDAVCGVKDKVSIYTKVGPYQVWIEKLLE